MVFSRAQWPATTPVEKPRTGARRRHSQLLPDCRHSLGYLHYNRWAIRQASRRNNIGCLRLKAPVTYLHPSHINVCGGSASCVVGVSRSFTCVFIYLHFHSQTERTLSRDISSVAIYTIRERGELIFSVASLRVSVCPVQTVTFESLGQKT